MNNVKPTLCLKKISKSFKQGSQNLEVLKGVDLEIMPGEIVALIGPSGSSPSSAPRVRESRPCCKLPGCWTGRAKAK